MKYRKFVSLIALLSFIVMALTGIVMFLAPQSRVAYWSGWELFGLSKRDYDDVHSTFMLLFLVSLVWHTVLNWRSLADYMLSGAKKFFVFSPELFWAFAICVVFFVGTMLRVIPFDQYLSIGGVAKDYWAHSLGTPPWEPADATPLNQFCQTMEVAEEFANQRSVTIDCDEALSVLQSAGIEVNDPSQPLDDIAAENGTTPRDLADLVMSVARTASSQSGGAEP